MADQLYLVGTKTLTWDESRMAAAARCRVCRRIRCKCKPFEPPPGGEQGTSPEAPGLLITAR